MAVSYELLKHFRRQLHANPEVSGMERETADRVIEFLKTCSPTETLTNVGGYGIIATWDSGYEGKEILFRAELDALPIDETNDFEYVSNTAGVSHKCGHDGHSTILCGLAQSLSINKIKNGKVRLLFQPAEETGEGAKAILDDDQFNNIKPEYAFALHNLPGFPLGEVVIKDDVFTAAVNSMIIQLDGKTSHAAEPENGINPALAVAVILRESIAKANNDPESEDMRVITPVYVNMGEKAYGISAGHASVHFTLRCWNNATLRLLEGEIEILAREIAKAQSLKISIQYTQTFHANVNDKQAVQKVRAAALKNKCPITEKKYPFKWGEDFGLFSNRFKGCMFGLGAGENVPALHNPDYDFPDELIEKGVNLFRGIINEIMLEK